MSVPRYTYVDHCAWRARDKGWSFHECTLVRLLADAIDRGTR